LRKLRLESNQQLVSVPIRCTTRVSDVCGLARSGECYSKYTIKTSEEGTLEWRGVMGENSVTPLFDPPVVALPLINSAVETRERSFRQGQLPTARVIRGASGLVLRLLITWYVASPSCRQNPPNGLIRYSIAAGHLSQRLPLSYLLQHARPFSARNPEGWGSGLTCRFRTPAPAKQSPYLR
jgi:hypothetical protein